MKRKVVLVLLAAALGGATLPGPIRADGQYWNMLTPAARLALSQVIVLVREDCYLYSPLDPFEGGQYNSQTSTILLCGPLGREPYVLRHETLHVFDWQDGSRIGNKSEPMPAVPAAIHAAADDLYPGWLTPAELWATVPLVTQWRFDDLPADLRASYAPWFIDAAH
jgi:hypothetical protein